MYKFQILNFLGLHFFAVLEVLQDKLDNIHDLYCLFISKLATFFELNVFFVAFVVFFSALFFYLGHVPDSNYEK
jgi:hypothetical protein